MRNAVNKLKPVKFFNVKNFKRRKEKKHPFEVLIGSLSKKGKRKIRWVVVTKMCERLNWITNLSSSSSVFNSSRVQFFIKKLNVKKPSSDTSNVCVLQLITKQQLHEHYNQMFIVIKIGSESTFFLFNCHNFALETFFLPQKQKAKREWNIQRE